MATITIPDGALAVVVFVYRTEEEADVKVVGVTDEDSEHGVIADAIQALVGEMVAITDEAIEEADAAATPPDGEGEEEEETEEPTA